MIPIGRLHRIPTPSADEDAVFIQRLFSTSCVGRYGYCLNDPSCQNVACPGHPQNVYRAPAPRVAKRAIAWKVVVGVLAGALALALFFHHGI